jgi:hypothetical protein
MNVAYQDFLARQHIDPGSVTLNQELAIWLQICTEAPNDCNSAFVDRIRVLMDGGGFTQPGVGIHGLQNTGGIFLIGGDFEGTGGVFEGSVTFYRGTTWGDANEVIDNQKFDLDRVAANQRLNPPASGPGIYLTTQQETAQYYADLAGGGGRGLGPAVIRISVPGGWWSSFAARNNIKFEGRVPNPPTGDGETETIIRIQHADEFSRAATFSWADEEGGGVGGDGGGGGE